MAPRSLILLLALLALAGTALAWDNKCEHDDWSCIDDG